LLLERLKRGAKEHLLAYVPNNTPKQLYVHRRYVLVVFVTAPWRPPLYSPKYLELDFSHSRRVANCVGQSFHKGP
jgi:hypothetical protein